MWHDHYSITQCLPQVWLMQPGRNLRQLEAEYHIKAKRHSLFPNLVQLKYSQLDADFNDPMVRQCRGLILDEADHWKIVAWPFNKFGNHGESYADQIDWPSATIQEKLDGSLMILYWYKDGWMVASSGMPDASGEVSGYGLTFGELFWDTFGAKKWPMPNAFQRHITFLFELTSPFNKIVVQHQVPDLKLIGMRNIHTGLEMRPKDQVNYAAVREYARLDDLEKLIGTFQHINPLQQEGYVVVDRAFRRIKVKHPGYVKLHHMRDQLTPKGILEVVRAGECAEVLAGFPEWADVFERVQARYDALAMVLDQTFDELKLIKSRKDFAEQASHSPMPAVLFMLLDGKHSTAKEALRGMYVERLMEALKMRELLRHDPLPEVA